MNVNSIICPMYLKEEGVKVEENSECRSGSSESGTHKSSCGCRHVLTNMVPCASNMPTHNNKKLKTKYHFDP